MDPVQRLLAIEEIKQLKAAYFWTVDRKDWSALAELFTDDAVFDMTAEVSLQRGADAAAESETVVVGGRAIAAFVASAVGEPITVHHGHMPVIEITGPSTATGRWTMFDDVDFGDRRMRAYGWYDEEYERVGERWRISRLDLHRWRADWTPIPVTLRPGAEPR